MLKDSVVHEKHESHETKNMGRCGKCRGDIHLNVFVFFREFRGQERGF